MIRHLKHALILGSLLLCSTAQGAEWWIHALRLTGESDQVRQAATRQLRQTKDLERVLKSELNGPRRPLALDVVTALSLRSLLPELIRLSKDDEQGAVHLAISSLINTGNKKQILDLYADRLSNPILTSVTARIVMLDTLTLHRFPLTTRTIIRLLLDRSYDVRLATLAYVRGILQHYKGPVEYLRVAKLAIVERPYQLRLQAAHLLFELPPPLRQQARSYLRICLTDPHPKVRNVCRSLSEKAR